MGIETWYVLLYRPGTDIHDAIWHSVALFAYECRIATHRTACHCFIKNAKKAVERAPEWKAEFTREEFTKPGFELKWRRLILELGSPDPACGSCDGTGILVPRQPGDIGQGFEWYQIGTESGEYILKDCVKGYQPNLNVVPVSALDLDHLPLPDRIIDLDGQAKCRREPVLHSMAWVVDENWEETCKSAITLVNDCRLVVVTLDFIVDEI